MSFRILDGGRDQPGFVCTFCAGSFPTRTDLDSHWELDPRCRRNKTASNATLSKYLPADTVQAVQGEETLKRIRSPLCTHPDMLKEVLKNDRGRPIGWRCGHCYTEVYEAFELEPSGE